MDFSFSFLVRKVLFRLDERLQLIIVAALVGLGGGYASVVLNLGLQHGGHYLMPLRSHWYATFFPAIGAALSIFFLHSIVRDIGGHGVPEVIYSISRRGGLLRFRSSFSRLVSCLLTIASGGSAGPEAPVVISGASIGSNIANFFYLKDRQRTVIVGCGAAAAIAAIFNAPATGIAFALEAILGEWTPINVVPIAIASIVGTEVSRGLQGNQIPFQHHSFYISNVNLLACLGLAILTAVSSVVFMRLLRLVSAKSGRVIRSFWLRAAIGGLFVGVIGLVLPDALGEGYEYVRSIIEDRYASGILLAGISILAKILATSLTIGSGGSGGIFAPCLVIGSFTGLFYQRALMAAFPQVVWGGEGYFGLLGMAGVMSSVLQAPMTGIFLIIEITGGYDVLVSVVLVSVLSATLSHFFEPHSIYHAELIERGELLRPRTDARVLSELSVGELLEKDCHVVHPEMLLREFARIVETSHRNYFPVEDERDGRFLGMIHLDDIRPYLFDQGLYDSVLVEEIMNRQVVSVSPEDELPDILRKFDETRSWSLPVVQNGRFLGLISKATLLDHYRKELMAQEAE
ncbi:MAG: chloride channel protein [Deltaproteobacteria bacterium]|nr:MAG: chloride channel protein [Desulfobacteraceae bacterium 4484_190.3]RLB18753.1 MAG: chloride channel protein [Deltaproteobacteria bacterium]